MNLRLPRPFQLILDRVFECIDLATAVTEMVERGVERRRLTGSCGTGHQNQPAGTGHHRLVFCQLPLRDARRDLLAAARGFGLDAASDARLPVEPPQEDPEDDPLAKYL